MLLSKFSVCKKSKFLKEQEAKGLLSTLGIKKTFKSSCFVRFSFVLKVKNE